MRYDAHSGIAVLHGVGILEKGSQMAEPTSYIVEIDEQGNTSIKYADGTPLRSQHSRIQRGSSAISADIVAVDSDENVTVKESITELGPLHSVRADATFSEGLNSVECNVTVKIGELEFGPFSFVHDNIPGGDDDAEQDEDVALPEAD